MMKLIAACISCLTFVVFLTSCGGSSSSNGVKTPNNPPAATSPSKTDISNPTDSNSSNGSNGKATSKSFDVSIKCNLEQIEVRSSWRSLRMFFQGGLATNSHALYFQTVNLQLVD